MNKLNPTKDNVFVVRQPAPRNDRIFFPETSSDINASDVLKFQVVAVGPGRVSRKGIRIPPEVMPGNIVLWSSYVGAPKEVARGIYSIRASDIMCVLERGPDSVTPNTQGPQTATPTVPGP